MVSMTYFILLVLVNLMIVSTAGTDPVTMVTVLSFTTVTPSPVNVITTLTVVVIPDPSTTITTTQSRDSVSSPTPTLFMSTGSKATVTSGAVRVSPTSTTIPTAADADNHAVLGKVLLGTLLPLMVIVAIIALIWSCNRLPTDRFTYMAGLEEAGMPVVTRWFSHQPDAQTNRPQTPPPDDIKVRSPRTPPIPPRSELRKKGIPLHESLPGPSELPKAYLGKADPDPDVELISRKAYAVPTGKEGHDSITLVGYDDNRFSTHGESFMRNSLSPQPLKITKQRGASDNTACASYGFSDLADPFYQQPGESANSHGKFGDDEPIDKKERAKQIKATLRMLEGLSPQTSASHSRASSIYSRDEWGEPSPEPKNKAARQGQMNTEHAGETEEYEMDMLDAEGDDNMDTSRAKKDKGKGKEIDWAAMGSNWI